MQTAIAVRLRSFPKISADSKTYKFASAMERRSSINAHLFDKKERVDFGLNFCIENGFEVFMSNAYMNLMCKEDEPDAPFIQIEFGCFGKVIDVKTAAKVILFGLSTDFVYSVPCEKGINAEYIIDRVEGRDLNHISVFFKCIGFAPSTK